MARIIGRLPHLHAAIRLAEAELCKIKRANKALNRPNRIVRSDIVLNACRKQARLVPALAGLECMIRHKPNRTSTPENAEFLPSLVGQISATTSAVLFRRGASAIVTNVGMGCGGRGSVRRGRDFR